MFHKIMVAYDDSPEAGRALKVAIELARGVGADLAVATVLEPLPSHVSFVLSANLALDWKENKRARCIRFRHRREDGLQLQVCTSIHPDQRR